MVKWLNCFIIDPLALALSKREITVAPLLYKEGAGGGK
jgi:hypothetical protein